LTSGGFRIVTDTLVDCLLTAFNIFIVVLRVRLRTFYSPYNVSNVK